MAWKLDVKHNTGIIVNYWKIEKVFIDVVNNKVEVSYQGWISEEEKDLGSTPVVNESFVMEQDLSFKVSNDFLSLCESLLRNEKFQSAVDA